MSHVSPSSERSLREALQRLAEGRPARSDGALTVAGLATEAGVSRSTACRATQVLQELSQLRDLGHDRPGAGVSDTDAAGLQVELARTKRANAETVRTLRASIDTLAQHVQVLSLENEALRSAVAANGGVVAPLRGNYL